MLRSKLGLGRLSRRVLLVGLGATAILLVGAVGSAFASVKLMKAEMHRVSGADPSVSAMAPAHADSYLDERGRVHIDLKNMDPARFPANGSCQVEARAGTVNVKGRNLVELLPVGHPKNAAGVPITVVDVSEPGSVITGDKAQIRVRCEWMSNGQKHRHETQWQGTY